MIPLWLSRHIGAVMCWYTRRHIEIWESGRGSPWGTMPDVYWERTYCIRCGVTLAEKVS